MAAQKSNPGTMLSMSNFNQQNPVIKTLLRLIPLLFLASCASLYTLSDEADKEFSKPDFCAEDCTVHRVYAGTALDLCLLRTEDSGQAGAIAFYDLPFSFVVDSLVLPYSLYKQLTVGGSISQPIAAKSACKP